MPASSNIEQLNALFSDIADAIREKGVSGTMTPIQMPQKILDAFGSSETAATPTSLVSVLAGIADSIRIVAGTQDIILPSEMAQKIQETTTEYWGLTFTAQQAGSTIQMVRGGSTAPSPQLKVSYNGGSTWTPYTFSDLNGQTITLAKVGDKVCFAADDGVTNSGFATGTTTTGAVKFSMTGSIAASGDISSLLKDDEENAKDITLSTSCFVRMFENCTSLTEAPELPATNIGMRCYYRMFAGCSNLTKAPEILPATTLANICYMQMFINCTSLTEAPLLPATTLGSFNTCYSQMFNGCSSLSEIEVYLTSWTGGTNPTTNWVNGVAATGTFICPTALGTDATITRGANYCPEGWTVTTNPNGTTKVKYTSASGLPDWEGEIVGELTSSSIPNKGYIETVDIGTYVTSIGGQAFYGCQTLTEVTIPGSVTSIGWGAFSHCNELTSVTIGNGVTSIGSFAFSGCGGLAHVEMPESVTSIGNSAFYDCNGFTNMKIPNDIINVSDIGESAFGYRHTPLTLYINKPLSWIQPIMNTSDHNNWFYGSTWEEPVIITFVCSDGTTTLDVSSTPCFLKGTKILLSDNTTKNVEDITYDDTLKVWNFDEGHIDEAKPCWITAPGFKQNHYYELTFSDGTILRTTGTKSHHRVFNLDTRKFVGVNETNIGDRVKTINGEVIVTDKQRIDEEVEYYNLITSRHINCYAEGILTSHRYNNRYPIDVSMTYNKEGRTIRPYEEFEEVGIERYWYDNFCLGEIDFQTIEETKKQIDKCKRFMLPIE